MSTSEVLKIDSMATSHGLTMEEYQTIIEIMGRRPNMVELGIFSVMWSEHCSYKSTRKHIKKLPTKGERVICGPGENAGVIDINDGDTIIFKMESHNHPSFIEPYQGAATGVGGILRDVFTMGARPIALMNALRFGDINHPKTRHLINGVVKGIGGYGNCVGIPTVGGETNFDESYNGNILVNAMAVGHAKADKIFYSAASKVGASLLYAGSKTGRDGIHGATMASAEFDDKSDEKRPTVQVGDPFAEKKLIEACLELMQSDAIVAIQDMGAAGLTSSSFEMASKGGTGVELELDKVPMRETGMTPYEIMLSESQERMLMLIKEGKEELAHSIFAKWDIDSAVIGKITDTGKMVLKFNGEIVADMPIAPLSDNAPVYDRPWKPTENKPELVHSERLSEEKILEQLKKLMASPNLCSRAWIWQQYDSKVGNDTMQMSGGDAAVVRIHGTEKAIAITTDCTPRYIQADPQEGAKQAVAETYRNLVAVGATPIAITNCLNFGNPEKPEIMGQIVGSIAGIAEACEALSYPVVSGNASLYNETNGKAIKPTPAIGGVGLITSVTKSVSISFKAEGQPIIRIGDMKGHLGASIYAEEILGIKGGYAPPPVNLEDEKKNAKFILFLIEHGWLTACHDVSDGGQLVAIAEMAMAGEIGCKLDIAPVVERVFGEDQGRYIITATHKSAELILSKAPEFGVTANVIGETFGDSIFYGKSEVTISELKKLHSETLPKHFG
ncbi:MAG TPA: phosphoribosylformylglycinamidine synthase subunit PurL [Alphaproteobacteria bacterium]|nr:phosphoribosylformylglycinamidine synthase subunit PurL [Alphaproteobacteria bacterium]